jgi:hypothetical protein
MHRPFDDGNRKTSPVVQAFHQLVIGAESLPTVIATFRLEYDDIEQLISLVMLTHERARFAVDFLCEGGVELPANGALMRIQPADIEIFEAMVWMLETQQPLSIVCGRHGFKTRQRRRLLLLLADYHSRVSAALEGVTAIARRGHDRALSNSFERAPLIALPGSERMRLARNHLHVERLKGGKAPKLKNLMKQFGLTVDEALAVTGRGKDKEFTK